MEAFYISTFAADKQDFSCASGIVHLKDHTPAISGQKPYSAIFEFIGKDLGETKMRFFTYRLLLSHVHTPRFCISLNFLL